MRGSEVGIELKEAGCCGSVSSRIAKRSANLFYRLWRTLNIK
jgi:hypothetical protein